MHRVVICLAFLALCVSALRGEEWSEFRGPTGQGHAAARNLPLHWSSTDHVAWSKAIPGKGWSSPVLCQGKLYLTTAVPGAGSEQSLRAVCLDAGTGEILWNVQVFQQADGQSSPRIHSKNSHASASPITDGKRLFVHFGAQGTACLDFDGKIVWKTRELKYAPVHGNGGSPVLVDDLLVVSCDGGDLQFLAALEQATGKIRWKTPRPGDAPKKFAFSTPLVIEVGGKKQIVSSGANSVGGFDPGDGHEIWRVRYDGYSTVPRPVFGLGLLFIGTGYDSPSLIAVRPDGLGDVTDTHVVWTIKKGAPLNPSPLLIGQELYLIDDGGVATCLDAQTGKTHWQKRIGGTFSASPLFADGKIYLQSEDGEGIVLKPGLEFEELARNPLGERSLASYAVADGALFIRTEKHLTRFEGQ